MSGLEVENSTADRIPPSAVAAWTWLCGPANTVKLDISVIKKLRCTAILILVFSLIELGVGGAAADILHNGIGRRPIGAWWGAINPLISSIVCIVCVYESRLWNNFSQSVIAAIVSLVAAICDGIASNKVAQILTTGQVYNSTAAAEYVVRGKTTLPAGMHFMNVYGSPAYEQQIYECLKQTPSNPASLMLDTDDTPITQGICKGKTNYLSCLQAVSSAPKYSPAVCYTFSGYVGSGCGATILHTPPTGLPQIHNCGEIISVLPDVAMGSTVLLTMICVLCILQAYHSGQLYYRCVKGSSLSSQVQDDSVMFAGSGTSKPNNSV